MNSKSRRKFWAIFTFLCLALGATVFFGYSNLNASNGNLKFSPGEGGLTTLKIRGPAGWYCVRYTLTDTDGDSSNGLELARHGWSKLPFFGGLSIDSNYWPQSGKINGIPLEKPYKIHGHGNTEYYVLLTQDPSGFRNKVGSGSS